MRRERRALAAVAVLRLLLLPMAFGLALAAWLLTLKYIVEQLMPLPIQGVARPVLYIGGFLLYLRMAGYALFRR